MHTDLFSQIVSMDNLYASWLEFRAGKRSKADVQVFERHLEDHLFELHRDLTSQNYRHQPYSHFTLTDPKLRHIHKATVRDRIVHHAVHRILYPIFNPGFIYDSYSCRVGKGTHRAVRRLASFTRKVSQNYTRPCWVLKCDIRKFFDSVDQNILLRILYKKVLDPQVQWLLKQIITSYPEHTHTH